MHAGDTLSCHMNYSTTYFAHTSAHENHMCNGCRLHGSRKRQIASGGVITNIEQFDVDDTNF